MRTCRSALTAAALCAALLTGCGAASFSLPQTEPTPASAAPARNSRRFICASSTSVNGGTTAAR